MIHTRQVYYINVGTLPTKKANDFMKRFIKSLPAAEEVSVPGNHVSRYFVPVNSAEYARVEFHDVEIPDSTVQLYLARTNKK